MNLFARTVVALASLALPSLLIAQAVTPVAAPDAAGASAPAATTADTGWPRTYEKAGSQIILYQPQVDSWQDHARIVFRLAVAVTPAGDKEPTYGVATVRGLTSVDLLSRLVTLDNMNYDLRFADAPPDKSRQLTAMVREVLPADQPVTVSLDRVLAYMKNGKSAAKPVAGLAMTPPTIFYSSSPAILVVCIGKPQFKPIANSTLQFAINTNWDLFLDPASKQYYLRNENSWLTAPDPVAGPWTAAESLPTAFANLPADDNWTEVRSHIPGEPAKTLPRVFLSTQPALLILSTGQPAFTPLAGTSLAYLSNPTSPVFLNKADNTFYYLAAGRWFRASSLEGPWSAASIDLPADFAKIPADSPVAFVRASVPATPDADDATLLASVPHKATINRQSASVDVTYDGAPAFAPIEGTSLQYATNSPQQVILCQDQYYCCYKGVWFVSPIATGPYYVAANVPQAIYSIPPSSPLYNTTYVQVYSSTPDTVDVGYTSGYYGEYVAPNNTLVLGAGYALPANANCYYACTPAYYSYGGPFYYNYAVGSYCPIATPYYGPYGGAAYASHYNPATGVYSRSAAAWGPAGQASFHSAYNPCTGNYGAHAQASNGYESWGRTAAQVGNTAIQAGHHTSPAGTTGWVNTSNGRSAAYAQGPAGNTAVKTGNGDVYAGHDGNVYQRSPDGQWQQHSSDGWHNYNQPRSYDQSRYNQSMSSDRLNQDAAARNYGDQRATQTQQYRSSYGGGDGGYRGGGGYNGGGGGFRGGGGGGGRR